jgi:drug/metabolite transporter (DMT)-like permease
MRSLYPPFLVAVVGVVVYHIAQRSIPRGASPLATLVLAYAIASVLCVASLALYSSELSVVQTLRGAGWPVVALGVGIAGVEIGVLLSYRAGWPISVLPVITSVAVALVLVPVGYFCFHEQLSPRHFVGIAFCLAGLALIR